MRTAEGAVATGGVARALTAARTAMATAAATRSTVTTTAMKAKPMARASEGRNRGELAERAFARSAAATYAKPADMATAARPSSRYYAWKFGSPAADHTQSARPVACVGIVR